MLGAHFFFKVMIGVLFYKRPLCIRTINKFIELHVCVSSRVMIFYVRFWILWGCNFWKSFYFKCVKFIVKHIKNKSAKCFMKFFKNIVTHEDIHVFHSTNFQHFMPNSNIIIYIKLAKITYICNAGRSILLLYTSWAE